MSSPFYRPSHAIKVQTQNTQDLQKKTDEGWEGDGEEEKRGNSWIGAGEEVGGKEEEGRKGMKREGKARGTQQRV